VCVCVCVCVQCDMYTYKIDGLRRHGIHAFELKLHSNSSHHFYNCSCLPFQHFTLPLCFTLHLSEHCSATEQWHSRALEWCGMGSGWPADRHPWGDCAGTWRCPGVWPAADDPPHPSTPAHRVGRIKGKFIRRALNSSQDRSRHFTLYSLGHLFN